MQAHLHNEQKENKSLYTRRNYKKNLDCNNVNSQKYVNPEWEEQASTSSKLKCQSLRWYNQRIWNSKRTRWNSASSEGLESAMYNNDYYNLSTLLPYLILKHCWWD